MKIICVGRNYSDHAKELNNPIPEQPVIFLKPKSALVKQGHPILYPEFTDDSQYECELVLKICKNGKDIPERFAGQYYNEWTVGLDLTARDLQQKLKQNGLPWELAKSFDNAAALGKFIPAQPKKAVSFSLNKNGEQVQLGNSSEMLFSFAYIIYFVSRYFTLEIGDLIFTGTPAGVGPLLPYDHMEGFLNGTKLLDLHIE
jgi:2-keto-4-pentenoate hydratase/2-oxohepta-3-ene-1,7-dioic acid hydratase in catechol pathway